MPRTCLACSSSVREDIDKALVAGESLRNIAKRVSISPAALVRHKSHVAGAIAKAQERREEKLSDTIFDEMKRVLAKAWELLGKMELAGDYRGAIVAAREVRECLGSLNGLVTKAESGSGGIKIIVQHIGGDIEPNPAIDQWKRPIEIEAVSAPSNGDEVAPVAPMPSDETERGPAQSAVTPSGQAQNSLRPSSSTVPLPPASQSKGFAIMPPEKPKRRFPLTRTGAAMAFLRGGGSR